jgi:hypothetical protein
VYIPELVKDRESAMQTRQLSRGGMQLTDLDRSDDSREATAGILCHSSILRQRKSP